MPIITVTIQPPVDPEVPTLTYYQQLAAEIMAVFEQLNALIPKIEEFEAVDGKAYRTNLGVPDAFCVTAISAVEQLPELDGAKTFPTEHHRNRLQFVEAFRPVVQKGMATMKRAERALRAAKSLVATDCLKVYRVVKSYASDRKNSLAEAHAAALKHDLNKKSMTKAEREERKTAKLNEEVEQKVAERVEKEVAQRLQMLGIKPEEVMKAA